MKSLLRFTLIFLIFFTWISSGFIIAIGLIHLGVSIETAITTGGLLFPILIILINIAGGFNR